MKAMFSKGILAGAVAVASLFAGSAQAQDSYPDFTVQIPGTGTNAEDQFTADKIVANYVERISFVPSSTQPGQGTFNVNLFFDFSNFQANDGRTDLDGTLLNEVGRRGGYDVYGFYTATGTFAPNANGTATVFTFTPGAGSSLSLWLDRNNDTSSSDPNAVLPGQFTGTGEDVLLATGTGIFGEGNLLPDASCAAGGDCGSFTSITSFSLTAAGGSFFIAPKPFFNIAIERGQLNSFPVSGEQTINGSLDISFQENRVPEPASLGLLGLGLLGLGAARRRKQAK